MAISEASARLEIGLLNADARTRDTLDFAVLLTNKGVPQEIVTRLSMLCEQTQVIAGEVIEIGKIIVMKIWEFVKTHPNMTVGIALGAALGALTESVPFIGPLIAPTAMALGAAYGGVVGHQNDMVEQGGIIKPGFIGITQAAISLAKEFFEFFVDILLALKVYFLDTPK